MPARLRVLITCDDLGRRVVVRVRLSSGGFSDFLGILENCDDQAFGIRDKRGKLRRLRRDEVVAAKIIPPAPAR